MNELAGVFADLEDPRAVNARCHSLHEILVIALCTVPSKGWPSLSGSLWCIFAGGGNSSRAGVCSTAVQMRPAPHRVQPLGWAACLHRQV